LLARGPHRGVGGTHLSKILPKHQRKLA
jgi:hypothetical protein